MVYYKSICILIVCAVLSFSSLETCVTHSFLSLLGEKNIFLCMDGQPSWKVWALRDPQLHRCIDKRSKQPQRNAGHLSWGFCDMACCHLTSICHIRLVWNPPPVWLGQPLGAVGRPKYYWPFPLVRFWGAGGRAQLTLHAGGDSSDFTSSTCVHAHVCINLKKKKLFVWDM